MKTETIENVKDVERIIEKNKYKIFGLGGFPSTRSEVASLIKDYEIFFINKTGEYEAVRRKVEIRQFKKKYTNKPYFVKKPEELLLDKRVVKLINKDAKNKKIGIYVYLATEKSLEICARNHWRLIGNPGKIYKKIDNRLEFYKILDEIGYRKSKIVVMNLRNLRSNINQIYGTLGENIVIQLLDEGGGRGTFFVNKRKNGDKVIEEIEKRLAAINRLGEDHGIVISQFIKGPVMSITGCITRDNGILSSYAQYQLIDIKESVIKKEDARGVFCGHDWSLSNEIPGNIHKKAESLAGKIGKALKRRRALGIFGIDFIWDDKNKKIFPLEINPRLLGSFPTTVYVQLEKGEIPLAAFHILDFLKIRYKIKSKKVYKKSLKRQGSQLLLFNPRGYDIECVNGLKGGVYQLAGDRIIFSRPGTFLSDIKNEKEFILTDGVPVKGSIFKKNGKILRIMTKRKISKNHGYSLNKWAKSVVRGIYKKIKFKKYEKN